MELNNCAIVACKLCSHDGNSCAQCAESFVLTYATDGCYLPFERKLLIGTALVIAFLLVIIIFGCWQSSKLVFSESDKLTGEQALNSDAMLVGLKQWKYARFLDWSDEKKAVLVGGRSSHAKETLETFWASVRGDMDDPGRQSMNAINACIFCRWLGSLWGRNGLLRSNTSNSAATILSHPILSERGEKKTPPPRRYPWLVRVHFEFIVGVGLPLFYNFHFLPGLAASLTFLATWGAHRSANCKFDDVEALGTEATSKCLERFGEILTDHLLVLWIILLLISWFLAWTTRLFAGQFFNDNSMMQDFALHIQGLPTSMISEDELLNVFGVILESQGMRKDEIVGISIGYNLTEPELHETVFGMTERLLIQRDVYLHSVQDVFQSPRSKPRTQSFAESSFFSDVVPWPTGYPEEMAKPEDLEADKDKAAFRKLLEEDRLRGSGRAFIVFKSKDTADYFSKILNGFWLERELPLNGVSDLKRLQRDITSTGVLKRAFNGGGELVPAGSRVEIVQLKISFPDSGRSSMEIDTGDIEVLLSALSEKGYLKEDAPLFGETLEKGTKIEVGNCSAVVQWHVRVDNELCEPPSVLWYNLGTPTSTRRMRLVLATVLTFFAFLILWTLVINPLNEWLVTPYSLAGANLEFLTQQIVGISIGIVIQLLNLCMWIRAWGVGFWHVFKVDVIIICYNVMISYIITGFWVYPAILPKIGGFMAVDVRQHSGIPDATKLSDTINAEKLLADSAIGMLVPGWLFSSFLIGQVLGRIYPVLQNWILLRTMFVWECLPQSCAPLLSIIIPWNPKPPKLTARQAELVFQPPELALAWDYAVLVVNPSVSLMLLFVLSSQMWRIFPVMLAWVVFMYFYHRFGLLRLSKKRMFTTMNERQCAAHLWGLPLSLIAAAWAFWGARIGRWSIVMVPTSFAFSLLLHCSGLHVIASTKITPWVEEDDFYDDVAQRLIYDWFNTNPIYVLKCCYYPEHLGRDHRLSKHPFQFGKEYHQLERYSDKNVEREQRRAKAEVDAKRLHHPVARKRGFTCMVSPTGRTNRFGSDPFGFRGNSPDESSDPAGMRVTASTPRVTTRDAASSENLASAVRFAGSDNLARFGRDSQDYRSENSGATAAHATADFQGRERTDKNSLFTFGAAETVDKAQTHRGAVTIAPSPSMFSSSDWEFASSNVKSFEGQHT